MSNTQKTSSISERDDRQQLAARQLASLSEQLALPLTVNERAESSKQLRTMHRGNRFRLMLGQKSLSER